jgi:hypothetical protein
MEESVTKLNKDLKTVYLRIVFIILQAKSTITLVLFKGDNIIDFQQ